ncbi:hypothetical protein TNCV_1294041 [Trichonephila clavipes]|nr:hypothetical protein TNCV_1294041 [Trichonephila clavipes]
MEQPTVSESHFKDPMEQSKLPESPLKESVDSKPPYVYNPPVVSKLPIVSKPPIVSKSPVASRPPVVSKSPDPPLKKARAKKVDSVIHRFPRSRERRHEERRNEERRMRNEEHEIPDSIEDHISGPRIKGPECFGDPLMQSN